MISGMINIYKEQGYTSFDVVAKLRGILKQKKIGHTGTLDPLAEGVLIVCLGNATKLVDMLTIGTKKYSTVMKLGLETDTEDITGSIIEEKGYMKPIMNDEIIKCINSFVGKNKQVPPMYSAIKKDGKKLYEYARQGIVIEREPRDIEIFSVENIIVDNDRVSFDVHCSKGTYIRSLCRDIGRKLGCGAVMEKLIRKEVHGHYIEDSLKLEDVERLVDNNRIKEVVQPFDSLLKQYTPYMISESAKKYLLNGNILYPNQISIIEENTNFDNDIIRIYDKEDCLALYMKYGDVYKPYKMFLS